MLKNLTTKLNKRWPKLTFKNKDGTSSIFRVIDVCQELVEDFVEFHTNHFARKELCHKIAGIHNNIEALLEYKAVTKNTCNNKLYRNIICCPEINGIIVPKIIASATTKLHSKTDRYDDIPSVKTKHMKILYQIDRECYQMYPISNLMERYGVDIAVEFCGISVHPDYYKSGIATELIRMRPVWHKIQNNALGFAWTTSEGTHKAAAHTGAVLEFKFKTSKLANILNITLDNTTHYICLWSFRF